MDKGLCQCGCGLPAPLAKKTDRSNGRVKGQPMRFISGHNWRGIPRPRRGTPEKWIGHRFGRLLLLEFDGYAPDGALRFLTLCDCGTRRVILLASMKRGATKSCGCINREGVARRGVNRTHGHTVSYQRTRTYNSWSSMRKRCNNPNEPRYEDYGGRGITVCDRWDSSFENFLADMGERPEKRTLDRIDVNGNYEPGNCRWATGHQQRMNRRPTKR